MLEKMLLLLIVPVMSQTGICIQGECDDLKIIQRTQPSCGPTLGVITAADGKYCTMDIDHNCYQGATAVNSQNIIKNVDYSNINIQTFYFAKEMFILNSPSLPINIDPKLGCSIEKGNPTLVINSQDPPGCSSIITFTNVSQGYFTYYLNQMACRMTVTLTIDDATMNYAFFDLVPLPHVWPFTIEIIYQCTDTDLTLQGAFGTQPLFSDYNDLPSVQIINYPNGSGSGITYKITAWEKIGTAPYFVFTDLIYYDIGGTNRRTECPLTYQITSSDFDPMIVQLGTAGVDGTYKVALKDSLKGIQGTYILSINVQGYVEPIYTKPSQTVTLILEIRVCSESVASIGQFEAQPVFYNDNLTPNILIYDDTTKTLLAQFTAETNPYIELTEMTYLDISLTDFKINCPITYEIIDLPNSNYDQAVLLSGTSGIDGIYKYALKNLISSTPGIYELVIIATAKENLVTKTFSIPIEIKRNCGLYFNTIQQPTSLIANSIPQSTLTPPTVSLGKTWQEKQVGDHTFGFEFEQFTNIDASQWSQGCQITQYEILDAADLIYVSKFEDADNMINQFSSTTPVNLNAHHSLLHKNLIEILYFKIRITLDDGEITSSPYQQVFPASDFYTLQYDCFPQQYDINFEQVVDQIKYRGETGSFVQQVFTPFTTIYEPCPVGRYKVFITNGLIENEADASSPIQIDPECVGSQPCNKLRISTGYETLLDEEFTIFIRGESEDLRPYFLKYQDTAIFKVTIKCGLEQFSVEPTNERMIFVQDIDGNDIIYEFDTKLADQQSLLSHLSQQSISQYFFTDQMYCPVYSYTMKDKNGDSLEVDGNSVKLEVDGLPRVNNINDLNWKPKLKIRGDQAMAEVDIQLVGTTVGMIQKILNLEIGVCGFETMHSINQNHLIVLRHAQVNGTKVYAEDITSFNSLDKFFEFKQNQGYIECYNSYLKLCYDPKCNQEWVNNHQIVFGNVQDQQQLIISKNEMFKKITLYLYRETRGKPFGIRYYDSVIFEIESCGLEKVTVINSKSNFISQTIVQFQKAKSISFEELLKQFKSSSLNCPIIKFSLADYRSQENTFQKYEHQIFSLDDEQNLNFQTQKIGTQKVKLTPMLHSNYAHLDIELIVLSASNDYVNFAPQFMTPLKAVQLYDFSQDEQIMQKLKNRVKNHQVELRYQLPKIEDVDGVVSYSKLIIEDRVISSSIQSLGSLENDQNGLTTLMTQNQFMKFDMPSQQIVLRFQTINDLINVNGTHPINISIKDSRNGETIYQAIFKFQIPSLTKEENIHYMDIIKSSSKYNYYFLNLTMNDKGELSLIFPFNMMDQYNGFNISHNFAQLLDIQVLLSQEFKDYMIKEKVENQTEFLSFNSSAISFIKNVFKIKIIFNNPLIYHSGIYVRDYIQVQILKPELFIVKEQGFTKNYLISNDSLIIKQIIPQQFDNSYASEQLITYSEPAQIGIESFTIGNIILVLVSQLALNQLFAADQFAQLYVYHQLVNIEHPANSCHTALMVSGVINADFLPNITTDRFYDFTEEERYGEIENDLGSESTISQALIRMDYGSFNSLTNLGGAYVMMVAFTMMLITKMFIAVGILFLKRNIGLKEIWELKKQNHKQFKLSEKSFSLKLLSKLLSTNKRLNKFLFLTAPIRLVYEQVIQFSIAGNLHFIRPNKNENNVDPFTFVNSELVAYVCIISCWVLLPIISILPILITQEHQNSKGFQRVFGDILSNIKHDKISQSLYNLMYMLRRILISVIAIYLKNNSAQQLQIIIIMNFLSLIYIGFTRPFKKKLENQIAIMNEFTIGALQILYLIFTEFCPNKLTQFQVGWIVIVFFVLIFAINIGIQGWNALHYLALLFKINKIKFELWFQKRKERKLQELNEQNALLSIQPVPRIKIKTIQQVPLPNILEVNLSQEESKEVQVEELKEEQDEESKSEQNSLDIECEQFYNKLNSQMPSRQVLDAFNEEQRRIDRVYNSIYPNN